MRAVIDTNVWVSAVLSPRGRPALVLRAYRDGYFSLVTSEPLLAELHDVLSRPHLHRKHGVTAADAAELDRILRLRAEIVDTAGESFGCRDPEDGILIETAIVGNARLLVSRDEDLTADRGLHVGLRAARIGVYTVRHFVSLLGVGS